MFNILLLIVTINPAVGRVNVPDGSVTYHGTGTLIANNIVITNWHVVRDSDNRITVTFPSGTVKATVIKIDKTWDLAALCVDCKIEPVQLGKLPKLGDTLTIAGYGSGDYREKSGRLLKFLSPSQSKFTHIIELSVGARNGDSGGPMLTEKGTLTGVLFGSRDGRTYGTHIGRIKLFLKGLQ